MTRFFDIGTQVVEATELIKINSYEVYKVRFTVNKANDTEMLEWKEGYISKEILETFEEFPF